MIRAPKLFNGTFINRHLFPSFFKYNRLSVINSGRCYDWAYFAHRLFGAKLWSTDYHAWVQYGKKFYDSEAGLHGVSNFLALKCNKRNCFPLPWDEMPPATMDLKQFKSFWDSNGGGHRRHWDSMLEPQLQEVLGKRYSELTPIFHPRKM